MDLVFSLEKEPLTYGCAAWQIYLWELLFFWSFPFLNNQSFCIPTGNSVGVSNHSWLGSFVGLTKNISKPLLSSYLKFYFVFFYLFFHFSSINSHLVVSWALRDWLFLLQLQKSAWENILCSVGTLWLEPTGSAAWRCFGRRSDERSLKPPQNQWGIH